MGAGISENYSNIQPIFNTRYWKVHSAIHKQTQQPASLWVIDMEQISKIKCPKAQREKFLEATRQSILRMRRILHPNVLKILEVGENPKNIGFVAEPVANTLKNEVELSGDDYLYIADQMGHALKFFHETMHLALLDITPDTVCLGHDLTVKFFSFQYASEIGGDGTLTPTYGAWADSPFQPPVRFSSPEYISNGAIFASTDVFSFATTIIHGFMHKPFFDVPKGEEMVEAVYGRTEQLPEDIPEELRKLLDQCIEPSPTKRPSTEQILKSRAFLQMSVRSLRYLDNILTQDNRDKFNFYTGLKPSLSLFSNRLLTYKVLPIIREELLMEIRFCTVLIPIIFEIGKLLEPPLFKRMIINPLRIVFKQTSNQDIIVAILNIMEVIIDKCDEAEAFDLLYPLYMSALQSESRDMRNLALKRTDVLIAAVSEGVIFQSLIPTLLQFIKNSDEPEIISSVMEAAADTLTKANHDRFCEVVIPQFTLCWNRLRNPALVPAFIVVFEKLKTTAAYSMKYVVSLITLMLSSHVINQACQLKFALIVKETIANLIEERDLVNKSKNYVEPEKKNDDFQIARPAEVVRLNYKPPPVHAVPPPHVAEDPYGYNNDSYAAAPSAQPEPKKGLIGANKIFNFGKKNSSNSIVVDDNTSMANNNTMSYTQNAPPPPPMTSSQKKTANAIFGGLA